MAPLSPLLAALRRIPSGVGVIIDWFCSLSVAFKVFSVRTEFFTQEFSDILDVVFLLNLSLQFDRT